MAQLRARHLGREPPQPRNLFLARAQPVTFRDELTSWLEIIFLFEGEWNGRIGEGRFL